MLMLTSVICGAWKRLMAASRDVFLNCSLTIFAVTFFVRLFSRSSDAASVLELGLVDQSQKMTVAAMQMADMKVCARGRSYC
jgi:hypothetical protein